MAETAAPFCLTSPSSLPSFSRFKDISPFLSPQSNLTAFLRPRSFRLIRISARASNFDDLFGNDDDPYGSYPWEAVSLDGDDGIEWTPEERVTFFTTDGLIQIGGSLIPRRIPPSQQKHGKSKAFQRYQRFQESDYMDPKQSLCLGALFDIAATNGIDSGRRLCIIGFCRSVEMLSDVVEDSVLEHGGEVVAAEKESKGGLQEKLTMTVAVPLLWGVPPASETLRFAIRSGGGIVDKMFWQWHFW